MDEAARLAAERACTALVHEWARALDFGDQDHFLELFEADGRLVYGAAHEGLDALARFVGARPRDRVTRHLITNVFVDVLAPDRARGICYLTLFAGLRETPRAVPPAPAPAAVGHFEDRFQQRDGCWRFASRTLHVALGALPEPSAGSG